MTYGTGAPFLYDYTGAAPYFYEDINTANGTRSPSTVHVRNTALTRFFQRYLIQRAMSRFKFTLPKTWNRDYVLYTLYSWGYFAVFKTDRFGVIPQACSLRGYDIFYAPTHAVITNPLLKGITTPRIGTQCTLIKLQPDYCGVLDLVTFYAEMMAMTAETAMTNIFNSKLSYVFAAENKTAAESFKKMYDKIVSGDPAVFSDKNLFNDDGSPAWMTFAQNLKENYIAGDLLEDLRKWELRFDTEIGIPNSNTEKKERMIVDEVNSNNEEVRTRSEMWLESLQEGFMKTHEMFGLNKSDLWVDWRESETEPDPEEVENGSE